MLEKALKACKKAMSGGAPVRVPALLHQLISFAECTDLRPTLAQVRDRCLLVVHVNLTATCPVVI